MDGLEVCREVRKTSAVPILFLTAQGDEIERIVGLEMGPLIMCPIHFRRVKLWPVSEPL